MYVFGIFSGAVSSASLREGRAPGVGEVQHRPMLLSGCAFARLRLLQPPTAAVAGYPLIGLCPSTRANTHDLRRALHASQLLLHALCSNGWPLVHEEDVKSFPTRGARPPGTLWKGRFACVDSHASCSVHSHRKACPWGRANTWPVNGQEASWRTGRQGSSSSGRT